MIFKLRWYGRKDGSPNYFMECNTFIEGENAEDCMRQLLTMKYNHDCAKYTPIEIAYVVD